MIGLSKAKTRRGTLVTVDGVDGVGKTTTCVQVAGRANGVYFKSPSEPFQSVRRKVENDIPPLSRYFFFRAATQNDSLKISKLLDQGALVICDRFILSTYCYHVALDPRSDSVFETTGLVEPDIQILLVASSRVRRERLAKRAEGDDTYDRALENDPVYQDKVQQLFQKQNAIEIDTGLHSTEAVVGQILDMIGDAARLKKFA